MARKKVKLSYIINDSARKATYKKRKKGLIKKLSEFSTLCDVKVCCIIYSAYDPDAEVWPSPAIVHDILSELKNMSHLDRSKKMLTQEVYITHRITKANDQYNKIIHDIRETRVTRFMFKCLASIQVPPNLSMLDFHDLQWKINQYHREVYKHYNDKKANANQSPVAMVMPMAPPMVTPIPMNSPSPTTTMTMNELTAAVNLMQVTPISYASVENMYKQPFSLKLIESTPNDVGIAINGDKVAQSNYEEENNDNNNNP